ncbi:MAG: hypothetical protein ABFC77_14505 [Thermoguttaceae bacterium]
MKNLMLVAVAILLLGSTAYGGWYVGPTVGYAYYPYPVVEPVYAYPAPVVMAQPRVAYSPILAPAPVMVARPVVVGPTGKVYIPGRPIRNAVRAVVP